MKPLLSRFTLLQQWAGATLLAILPLLVAVSYAAVALQEQTRSQRQLVQRMDALASNSAALADTLREMVRSARQYQLLRDPSFLALYGHKREALRTHGGALQGLLAEDGRGDRLLADIAVTADEVHQLLAAVPALTSEQLTEPLRRLVALGDHLTQNVDRLRGAAVQEGEANFSRIFEQLLLFTMLALPGTLLLLIIGTYRVSRPIWRLSQAIRALGQQQWQTPIAISGPADLVALGDNLEWMRQQVEASDRQKNAFIQHVTHELKTPLAAIIEAGNLLRDGVPAPPRVEQLPVLEILTANARNLNNLIQQLLNYNAVSHGLVTHCAAVDIRQLCENCRHSLAAAEPDKVVGWSLAGDGDQVHSDPRLLEMIVRNLLGNAFQFCSSPGVIEVEWRLLDDGWRLRVTDNGPGIDSDELEAIFTPFYKGRTGLRHRVPKNGIGLAIVKDSVALLKGSIRVVSTPGQGATFELHFPLQRADQGL